MVLNIGTETYGKLTLFTIYFDKSSAHDANHLFIQHAHFGCSSLSTRQVLR